MAPGAALQLSEAGRSALADGQCFRRTHMQTVPLQLMMLGVWNGTTAKTDGGPDIGRYLPTAFLRNSLGWADAAEALRAWLCPVQAGLPDAFDGVEDIVGQNGQATGLFANVADYFDPSNEDRARPDWQH
jgi:hypothetical protein